MFIAYIQLPVSICKYNTNTYEWEDMVKWANNTHPAAQVYNLAWILFAYVTFWMFNVHLIGLRLKIQVKNISVMSGLLPEKGR